MRRLKFGFTIFVLCAVLLTFACSLIVSIGRAQQEGGISLREPGLKTSAPRCCGNDANQPHVLGASYYTVANGMVATLMLNNKGPESVEVKPTLFGLTGEPLDVAPVIVPGESFRNIDLRELGAVPGTHFEQGSIRLFHLGPDLVIGAQLYLVDEARSLSFDEN
jgi:hypothetical protein